MDIKERNEANGPEWSNRCKIIRLMLNKFVSAKINKLTIQPHDFENTSNAY